LFGFHTLFDTQLLWEWLPATTTSRQDAAPTKKVNLINNECVVWVGSKAASNGLDYNLSHAFNQEFLAASCSNPVFA